MKSIALFCVLFFSTCTGFSQAKQSYKVQKIFHIASPGGWDYLAINGDKLYVSHGTQVNILNKNTGDSIGIIPNTNGVHGIAFDNALGKGYTSNGRANNVTVFDLKTGAVLGTIETGQNPDAILYDPFSKKIMTCNGRSNDISVIDPVAGKVVATVPVGGKPETAVSDEAGHVFINNEDKSEIVVMNAKTFTVENHWSILPGKAPTGLAIDRVSKRLFAGCDNQLLAVIDATSGKLVDTVLIGDGCDGVAFNAKNKTIYTSNGEGTMTVIEEKNANQFAVIGNVPTKRGARTIALDEATGMLFLPTADYEAATQNGRPRMVPGTFQVLVVY